MLFVDMSCSKLRFSSRRRVIFAKRIPAPHRKSTKTASHFTTFYAFFGPCSVDWCREASYPQEDWRDRDPNGRDGWRAERWRDNRQGAVTGCRRDPVQILGSEC